MYHSKGLMRKDSIRRKVRETGVQPVKSEALTEFCYLREEHILVVGFHSGRHYAYYGVSAQRVGRLRNAESIGNYYATKIKGLYESKEL